MFQRLSQRLLSFALAFVVTVGMLGGIDDLAQPEEAAPQWAERASQTRA